MNLEKDEFAADAEDEQQDPASAPSPRWRELPPAQHIELPCVLRVLRGSSSVSIVSYEALKVLHVTCALISYALFLLRGIWRFTGSRAVERQWVKVAPHINDTVLLAAALGLAWTAARNPALHGFFVAKISGLFGIHSSGDDSLPLGSNPTHEGRGMAGGAGCVLLHRGRGDHQEPGSRAGRIRVGARQQCAKKRCLGSPHTDRSTSLSA